MDTQNSQDWCDWLTDAKRDKKLGEKAVDDPDLRGKIALCAHQMMEHAIKAIHLNLKGRLAPRIHALPRLAALVENSDLSFSEEETAFLELLDSFFLPIRYPQNGEALPTHEKAVDLFDKACRLLERIEAELTQGEDNAVP
jgi:HEPN domain-containing protein